MKKVSLFRNAAVNKRVTNGIMKDCGEILKDNEIGS